MRIKQATKDSAMQQIAETHSVPMKAAPIKPPFDDQMIGNTLANECIALCMSQVGAWNEKAHRLFGLTIEAREQFLVAFRSWIKDKKAELAEIHGDTLDKKRITKALNSATVRVSQLATIAKAINAGMTHSTVAEHFGVTDPENVGIDLLVQLARDIAGASGAGRKPDAFPVKLSKWLDKATDEDKADPVYAKLVEFLATVKA